MRATASALLSGVYGIAGGLGPSLLGLLSDWLSGDYGPARGLAYAMAISAAIYWWASAHYFVAARHLPQDSEKIRQAAAGTAAEFR